MNAIIIAAAALGVLCLIFLLTALGGWFLMLGWNLGVHSMWALAPHLAFWPAFCISLALGVLGKVFGGSSK